MGAIGYMIIEANIAAIIGGLINASINIYSAFGTGFLNVAWRAVTGYFFGAFAGVLIFGGLMYGYLGFQSLKDRFKKKQ